MFEHVNFRAQLVYCVRRNLAIQQCCLPELNNMNDHTVHTEEEHLAPGIGQDGFFGYSYYFSNATQLGCLFTENSFPMGNTYICP